MKKKKSKAGIIVLCLVIGVFNLAVILFLLDVLLSDDTETSTSAEMSGFEEAQMESESDWYDYQMNQTAGTSYDAGLSSDFDLTYGSAKEFAGKTVLVSVFINDDNCSWDLEADVDEMYVQLNSLKIATDWLSSNAAQYGSDLEFIYDWQIDEDLYQYADLGGDMIPYESQQTKAQYIESQGNAQALVDKYSADNIIYLFFLNTPKSQEKTSYASQVEEEYGYDTRMEYVSFFTGYCDVDLGPASMAHELMHLFDAPDLYGADDGRIISEEYVNYLSENNSQDIMFTTYDYSKKGYVNMDKITNEFTAVDAYYVGIADAPEEVEKFGLGAPERQ